MEKTTTRVTITTPRARASMISGNAADFKACARLLEKIDASAATDPEVMKWAREAGFELAPPEETNER